MRKKIQDLVKGKFEYHCPKLITEKKVRFEVLENESYSGSFTISTEAGERVRGLITCTHPYMDPAARQFDDSSVEVPFTYHAVELEAGTKDKGRFVITSDCGEYQVPFEAVIIRYYHDSSIGKIKTVNDFANLAKLNWEEALKVFQSKFFPDILSEEHRLLYRGLCYRYATAHEMEEFLVGIGKKTRIQFSVDQPDRNLGRIYEDCEDVVRIFKSGWGHLDIQIGADADFIHLKDTHIQASHFTGRDTALPYSVSVQDLHAGKNFGRITLKTPFQTHVVELCVQKTNHQKVDAGQSAKKFNQRTYALLVSKYIDYKKGNLPESVWLSESLELFDQMIERDPSDRWNFLLKCQMLLLADKRTDAGWIFEDAAYGMKDKQSPQWIFIQYLKQQLEHREVKESKRQQLLFEVKAALERCSDNLLLFLLMLEMDPQLVQDLPYRYAAVKEFLQNGNCSPIIYMEAFEILQKMPSLVQEMDEIDVRICYWIAKQKLLTEDLIGAILDAAVKVRTYHPRYFWVLGRCYKITRDEACVRIICTYLITNNKYGEEFLHWFAKGLESKMRIGGINEAYIQSWRRTDGDIPEPVLRYFSTRTLLPAIYKCRLYAYVVRNHERLGNTLDVYRGFIIPFLEEELKKNHMNDELAEIARYVKTQITPEHWHEMNQNCINVEKVVSASSAFLNIAVCQQGVEGCQRASLGQSVAYIHLYSDVYQILFEDGYGYRYFMKDGYRISKMFPREWVARQKNGGQMAEISNAEANHAMVLELEEMAGTMDGLHKRILEAEASGLDVADYQEQLLVRMLFTGEFVEDHVSYFREICKRNDTTQLRDAYASWFSWRYLCHQEEIPVEVFEYLEYSVGGLHSLNRCCELALFTYLCKTLVKPELKQWFRKILHSLIEQGLKLPCFDLLPPQVKRENFMEDCTYVTYTGASGRKIYARLKVTAQGKGYTMNQPVLEVTGGLYVLAVRLFADEILDYEFIENEETILASGSVKLTQNYLKSLGDTRYGMLNDALRENQMQFEKMQRYAELTDQVNHLFQPI